MKGSGYSGQGAKQSSWFNIMNMAKDQEKEKDNPIHGGKSIKRMSRWNKEK